jgi:hypothetical protein
MEGSASQGGTPGEAARADAVWRRYFPRKSLKRASSTTWSFDKIALTGSDCGAM